MPSHPSMNAISHLPDEKAQLSAAREPAYNHATQKTRVDLPDAPALHQAELRHDEIKARISRSETGYDLHKLMKEFCRDFGFLYYYIVDLDSGHCASSQNMILMTSWPSEIVQRCASLNLSEVDPVISLARQSVAPVVWSVPFDEKTLGSEMPEVMTELLSDLGVTSGINLPVHNADGGRAVINFFGNRAPCSRQEELELYWLANQVFARLSEISSTKPDDRPKIALREIDCLKWTAAGKTSSETATILGLSEHTVNHYLTSAGQKLGASNRAHAVAKAVALGLVELP